jgi:hypothetical protein
MTTTQFIKSLNLQDKIIKSAKLTIKKIYLEQAKIDTSSSPLAGEGRVRGETYNSSSLNSTQTKTSAL